MTNFCCTYNPKELTLTFKNWELDDIVVELSRHIGNGYHICSCSEQYSYHEGHESEYHLIKVRD